MTDADHALEHLNRLREHVDGYIAEYVDALAQVVLLEKDISNPMYGAKATLYTRPPTVDRREVPAEEAPDSGSEEWNWQWSVTKSRGNDEPTYRFQPKVNEDAPDLVEHEAIVFEADVAGNAPDGDLWDPNEGEYKTADEYPLGTVNCIAPDSGRRFTDDYQYDVEVYSSIVPADDEPRPGTYTPGWPDGE